MSQEFYVLKCFSCESFQVHIVKKAKKWECKMCGAKQSLKRNYGKGSSKDCRNQVMKLNEMRLSKFNSSNVMVDEKPEEAWTDEPVKEPKASKPSVSKWVEFLEENAPDTESEAEGNLVELDERKSKRVKKMHESYSKNKKISHGSSCEIFSETTELCSDETKNEKSISFNEISHSKDFIQPISESKYGKYANYLQDNYSENTILGENKTPNIFEASLTDLDDILNF